MAPSQRRSPEGVRLPLSHLGAGDVCEGSTHSQDGSTQLPKRSTPRATAC